MSLLVVAVAAAGLLAPQAAAVADTDDAGGSSAQQNAEQYASDRAKAEAEEGLVHAAKPQTAPDASGPVASAFAGIPVDKTKFNAGNLMSDAVFYNGDAMTAAQVQSFLNTQVGTCNPDNKPNVQPCLKSYTTDSSSRPADAMCSGYTAATGETAATIIYKVGLSCGINQGVLVALLQKEQGLVTDDWPSATQYQFATGYACPDDPTGSHPVGCDPDTAGFFAQVYGAAWQFKRYANPAGTTDYFTWYPVGQVSDILYNHDATLGCGSAPVAIWNKATAALYYYTPYQPDDAAISDFFGNGDTCSEYGNRNFWGAYTQWFGDPNAGSVPTSARLAGIDRYATAVEVSKATYPTASIPSGVEAVYIANGLGFADALAAAPAAGGGTAGFRGPLLLTQQAALPASTLTEVKRLKPSHIYVVGGSGVVSDGVAAQLAGLAPTSRLSGIDRYATARAVAEKAFGSSSDTAYIATGMDFPDALSAGAAAGAHGEPVLMINGTLGAPDTATVQALHAMGITTVKIVGGTGVVSAGIQSGLSDAGFTVTRLSAVDRYGTSDAVNADAFPTAPPTTYFATALSFPDALAGAAAAGSRGSPLYVSRPTCVTADAATGALRSGSLALLGGTAVLGTQIGMLSVCR